ncbi:hypothetical protein [Rhodosalinus sediminis]|jgi:hypothetical protein|uniref:hypothetical protein n=1 Tax=Rhodosalinus sediminis TaxID=1940533 RepID=UPI002353609F|nr:hypothetical protein [Rhodosalinus sediminis]
MRGTVTGLLAAAVLLSGCAGVRDSRLNPVNWFGAAAPAPAAAPAEAEGGNPLIPERGAFARPEATYDGAAIARVTEVALERLPGGVVLRATGVAERQGPYDVRLTPVETGEADVRVFRFERRLPRQSTPVGPERTRTVTAAVHLDDLELRGVRRLRVLAADTARDLPL